MKTHGWTFEYDPNQQLHCHWFATKGKTNLSGSYLWTLQLKCLQTERRWALARRVSDGAQ